MPPETWAMPLVMMVISSERVTSGKKRTNRERRFRLAHEDAGGDVQRFGAARAHQAGHHARGGFHDQLHDAEVVEHREKRRDENDRRKRLEREIKTSGGIFLPEIAEDEGRSVVGEIQEPVGAGAQLLEDQLAIFPAHHQESEGNLQAEPPGDRLVADGAAVGGKRIRHPIMVSMPRIPVKRCMRTLLGRVPTRFSLLLTILARRRSVHGMYHLGD